MNWVYMQAWRWLADIEGHQEADTTYGDTAARFSAGRSALKELFRWV